MAVTQIASAACMLFFAAGAAAQGMAVGDSGPGATAALVQPTPTFYRHLMSFDKTVGLGGAGIGGTGCGGELQECCADGLCADDTLACAIGQRCLKCGTSGRPVCDAPSASPCGEGLVAKQGFCFRDFSGIIFSGGSPPPPGSYGGKIPPPAPKPPQTPPQTPPPDSECASAPDCRC